MLNYKTTYISKDYSKANQYHIYVQEQIILTPKIADEKLKIQNVRYERWNT